MKKAGQVLTWGMLLGLFALLLLQPQAAAEGAREGLALCGERVIPALFPFFVLSSMMVSLGAAAAMGRVLSPVLGRLLRLGSGASSALALGLVGGYPVGAQTAGELYRQGQCSREEAVRLLAFCNNCGPAFVLGVAGAGVFQSSALGAVLLLGHWLGALTVGLFCRFFGEKGDNQPREVVICCQSAGGALKKAVSGALLAMGNVCAYTVLFRVAGRLLEAAGLLVWTQRVPGGRAFALGILDLTGGVTEISPDQPGAVELAAFLMGFGGVSVLCQTMAVLDESGLPVWSAAAGKLLHGCAAAAWTHVLLLLLPLSREGMALARGNNPGEPEAISGGVGAVFGGLCLILWVFMLFHSFQKGKRRV